MLSAYKSEGDPALYEKAYSELKKFVEGSLDIYKVSYMLELYKLRQIQLYSLLCFAKDKMYLLSDAA